MQTVPENFTLEASCPLHQHDSLLGADRTTIKTYTNNARTACFLRDEAEYRMVGMMIGRWPSTWFLACRAHAAKSVYISYAYSAPKDVEDIAGRGLGNGGIVDVNKT